MGKSDVCPHECPDCGEACYLPFGLNPLCTNHRCPFFDRDTYVAHILSLPDPEDPIGHQDDGTFRDFCGSCHVPTEFSRAQYPDGKYGAWCPHCGQANYWEADKDIEEEDTQPNAPVITEISTDSGGGFNLPTQDEIQEAIREFLNTPIDKS